jgi:hypothetical protein
MTYVIAEPCIDINRRKRSRGLHLAKIASDPSQEGADATSSRASRFPPVTRGRNWPGLSQMNRSATHGERQGPAQRRLARFESPGAYRRRPLARRFEALCNSLFAGAFR